MVAELRLCEVSARAFDSHDNAALHIHKVKAARSYSPSLPLNSYSTKIAIKINDLRAMIIRV